MCDVCQRTNCSNRCPNTEGSRIEKCNYCDEPIEQGDKYVDIDGRKIHFECIGLMPIDELLMTAGISIETGY